MVIAQTFGEDATQWLIMKGTNFAEGVNVYEMCGMFAMWGPKALILDSDVTPEVLHRKLTMLRGIERYLSKREPLLYPILPRFGWSFFVPNIDKSVVLRIISPCFDCSWMA